MVFLARNDCLPSGLSPPGDKLISICWTTHATIFDSFSLNCAYIIFNFVFAKYLLARGSGSFRRRGMEAQDSRISILTQSLHNIKFLKMFGWEPHFHRLVASTDLIISDCTNHY